MKYTTDKDLESSSNILACKALAQCNQRNAIKEMQSSYGFLRVLTDFCPKEP